MSDTKPFLSNATYDKLKWLALVGLPALGVLYAAVALLWGLPKPQEVVGTIVAVDTFLGALLGVATKSYNASDAKFDGALEINANDTSVIHTLNLSTAPEDLGKQNSITLQVVKKDIPLSE